MEILKYNIRKELELDSYPALLKEIYNYLISCGYSFLNQKFDLHGVRMVELSNDSSSCIITRRDNSVIINETLEDENCVITKRNIFLGLNGQFYFQIVVYGSNTTLTFCTDGENNVVTMDLPSGRKTSDFSYLTYFKDTFIEKNVYTRTYMQELSKLASNYSLKEKIVKLS